MLSSLPNLADKNFLIGFIMPVLLGAMSFLALLRDLPAFRPIYAAVLNTDDFTKLTILLLVLWALALVLMLLNLQIYRLLEGYYGPLARKCWKQQMRTRFAQQHRMLETTRRIIIRQDILVSEALKREYFEGVRRFCLDWPIRGRMVLPTRFGNVIRASESYPQAVYGAEGITVWLRLLGVMAKDFVAAVDDARAQVDFFVNLCLFAGLFALGAAARAVVMIYRTWPDPHAALVHGWGYALAALVAALLCRLCYEGAIDRARAWGDLIRAGFDLYLPALAKQLGYKLPGTAGQRQRFWNAVGSSFLYQTPMHPESWPEAPP